MKKKVNQNFLINGNVFSDDRTDIYVGSCKEIQGQKKWEQNFPNVEGFKFEFEGSCCDYLYFVCWSNDSGQNGFLAQINGSNQVLTGSPDWEVFATGINYDLLAGRPSIQEINESLERACKKGWKKPFTGQTNTKANKPWGDIKTGIPPNANYIWYNSGKDYRNLFPTSPFVPFVGFNHDEFLIFRLPVSALFQKTCRGVECKKCDCGCADGCDGCNENASQQDQELLQRAQPKHNIVQPVHHSGACLPTPFEHKDCINIVNPEVDFKPCFYLHWGDSPGDVIENHDTEILYITVCNPYKDVEFKGFRITSVKLVPAPSQLHQARIVPDRFICYDCLPACSCKTREFVLITRDELNNYINLKHIQIEYCFDELVIQTNLDLSGVALFPINIIKDE